MRFLELSGDNGRRRGRPPNAHGHLSLLDTAKSNFINMPTRRPSDFHDYLQLSFSGPDRLPSYHRTELEPTVTEPDKGGLYSLYQPNINSQTSLLISAKSFSTYMPARSHDILSTPTESRQTDMERSSPRTTGQQYEQNVVNAAAHLVSILIHKQGDTVNLRTSNQMEKVTNKYFITTRNRVTQTEYSSNKVRRTNTLISSFGVLSVYLFCAYFIRYILTQKEYVMYVLFNAMILKSYQYNVVLNLLPTKTQPGNRQTCGTPTKNFAGPESNLPSFTRAEAGDVLPHAHDNKTIYYILNYISVYNMALSAIASDMHNALLLRMISLLYNYNNHTLDFTPLKYNTFLAESQKPEDGEQNSDTGNANSSKSSNLNNTGSVHTRPLGRRPLHKSQRSTDSNESDDEPPRDQKSGQKLLSLCQNSTVPNLALTLKEDDEKRHDSNISKETESGNLTVNIPQIKHTNHDTSIFDGISWILGGIRNISLFGVPHDVSRFSPGPSAEDDTLNSTFSFNISISDASNFEDSPQIQAHHKLPEHNNLTAIKGSPSIKSSPLLLSKKFLKNDCERSPTDGSVKVNDDETFRDVGTPYITPNVPGALSKRSVLDLSPMTPRRPRSRQKCRSECSSKPYNIPPATLLKRRLMSKINRQIYRSEDTPTSSRRRIASESDVNNNTEDGISKAELGCTHIRQNGFYNCLLESEHSIHLQLNFLREFAVSDTESENAPYIFSAIERELFNKFKSEGSPASLNPLKQTIKLNWKTEDVSNATINFDSPKADLIDHSPLLYLLVKLNLLSRKVTRDYKEGQPLREYNSLIICSMTERSNKVPIKFFDEVPESEPIHVLHLGKERAVNMIPIQQHIKSLEVFDISLENFSVLTILHDARKSFEVSLPKERRVEGSELDLHVLVIPFYSPQSNEHDSRPIIAEKSYTSIENPPGDGPRNDKPRDDEPMHGKPKDYEPMDNELKVDEPRDFESRDDEQALPGIKSDKDITAESGDVTINGDTDTSVYINVNDASLNQLDLNKEYSQISNGLFIDTKLCIGIINSNNNVTISKWMEECGLQPLENVQENRGLLLSVTQEISNGIKPPPIRFLKCILSQLLTEALDKELDHRLILGCKGLRASEKRQILLDHITEKHKELNDKESLPCLLTEEEYQSDDSVPRCQSSSSSDGENSDPDFLPINSAVKIKPAKGKYLQNQRKAKSNKTDVASSGNQVPSTRNFEIPMKTLEESLLKLQEKMKTYDEALDMLAKQQSKSISSAASKPSPSLKDASRDLSIENLAMLKKIEKLEKNNKVLFEMYNTQQTSIDNIIEQLELHTKENKAIKKKLSVIQGQVSERSKQTESPKLKAKDESTEIKQSISKLTSELKELRENSGEIRAPANLAPLVDNSIISETTNLEIKEELQKLKSSNSTLTTMLGELRKEMRDIKSSENLTSRADLYTLKCPCTLAVQHNAINIDHCYSKPPIRSKNTLSCNTKQESCNNGLSCSDEESFDDIERIFSDFEVEVGGNITLDGNDQLENDSSQNRSNLGKQDDRNHQSFDEPLECSSTSNTRSKSKDKRRKRNGQSRNLPSTEHTENMHTSSTRISYSSNCSTTTSAPVFTESTEPPLKSPQKSPQTEITTKSMPRQNEGEHTRNNRYQTHKCYIIHDTYMNNFSSDSFSRWFDVSCFKIKSLQALLQDGSLLSKIKAQTPETVFIHLGQGDLWTGASGDTVLDYYKQVCWKLLENTSTKICFSLMIPLNGSPRMNSVINQINKFLSDFVSDVRKDSRYNYKDRIFTSNNNSLSSQIIYSQLADSSGNKIKLSERGEKLLWLKLKDALNRTLGLIPQQRRRETSLSDRKQHSRNEIPNE